jgi:hypothetical protein
MRYWWQDPAIDRLLQQHLLYSIEWKATFERDAAIAV